MTTNKDLDFNALMAGKDGGMKRDAYETIDSINTSVANVDSIVRDAKENDPELYNEIKNIARNYIDSKGML